MVNAISNLVNPILLDAASDTATDAAGCGSGYSILIIYVLIFAALYLVMIRPNSKRKKQEEELKKNIDIGDEITTIGGICGKVVAVRDEDDEIILETGSDRVKLRFKKWCISANNTAIARYEEEKKRVAEEKAKAKEEKKAQKANKTKE